MSRESHHEHGADMSDTAILQRLDALTNAVALMARQQGARLTRAEVCERLAIHRNTLASFIETRGFPKAGRDGKWLLAEVVEWEAGR